MLVVILIAFIGFMILISSDAIKKEEQQKRIEDAKKEMDSWGKNSHHFNGITMGGISFGIKNTMLEEQGNQEFDQILEKLNRKKNEVQIPIETGNIKNENFSIIYTFYQQCIEISCLLDNSHYSDIVGISFDICGNNSLEQFILQKVWKELLTDAPNLTFFDNPKHCETVYSKYEIACDSSTWFRKAIFEKSQIEEIKTYFDTKTKEKFLLPTFLLLGGAWKRGTAICSDNLCPCPQVHIQKGQGYIFIENIGDETNIKLRANITCEQGAILRGLDLRAAREDVLFWWNTGLIPNRVTPLTPEMRNRLIEKETKKTLDEKKKESIKSTEQFLNIQSSEIITENIEIEEEINEEWWSKDDSKYSTGMEYQELLKTDLWSKRRYEILVRDNQKCTQCSATKGKHTILQVHHKLYVKTRLPWNYANADLITVCHECHSEIHQNTTIPFYLDEDAKKLNKPLISCDRCSGQGSIPEFLHIANGICFKCNGKRYLS